MLTISVVLVLLAGVAPPQAQKPAPPPTLTGKWTMTLELQMGTASPALELVQDGEKIAGTYAGRYGRFALTGTLKGRALQFSFTMDADGTPVVMTFVGEVAADFQSIKGEADMGGAGEAVWYARRDKSGGGLAAAYSVGAGSGASNRLARIAHTAARRRARS